MQLAVFDKYVDLCNEVSDSLQVIVGKFFNVVVTGAVDVIGGILMATCLEELDCVEERNDFISSAVDHEDRAVDIGNPVNVRKLVKWKGPSKVEHYSKRRHQRRVED